MADPESSQEYRGDVVGIVQEGQSVGQSFVSRRPGLNGVHLWLRPQASLSADNGQLEVALFHSPDDTQPVFTTQIPLEEIQDGRIVKIPIPAQADPAGQAYFLALSTHPGLVHALGRAEDAYPLGEAYANGQSVQGDLSFRLTYSYGLMALMSDLERWLGRIGVVLPLAATLWLPGRVLLGLGGVGKRFDWGERMGLSVGLSLATIAVLIPWTGLLRLPWNRNAVTLAAVLLLVVLLYQERDWLRQILNGERGLLLAPFTRLSLRSYALAAVFLMALVVRLIMVRDLAGPLWVDSVHHGMITRLISEQGMLPASYAPYLDIETANYHAGFHSALAVFHWLSGLEIPEAMLVFGQVLNALAVFAVYLFTTTFVKSRRAGVLAALLTGFFTPMPAYYTSWGRYTQLASLLILPAAAALIAGLLASKDRPIRWPQGRETGLGLLLLAGLASGGLFLTHYRVITFLACLLLAVLLVRSGALLRNPSLWRSLRMDALLIAAVAAIAVGLTLPWWPGTLSTLFIPKLAWSQAELPPFSDFTWTYLTTALGNVTLWLAGMGFVLGILRRKSFPLLLAAWVGLLFLLANLAAITLPGGLRLPGGSFVNNTSVEISLFIPISALGGYLLSQIIDGGQVLLPSGWRRAYMPGVTLGCLVLILIGARSLIPILNPVTMLYRAADRPALEWLAANVPEGETVLINPFSWGYGIYAGSDGGAWIVPSAGRPTLPPPVLYGLDNTPTRSRQVSDAIRELLNLTHDPVGLHAFLESQGIRYVYLGARGGAISAHSLQYSPLFRELYAKDGVRVFEAYRVTQR